MELFAMFLQLCYRFESPITSHAAFSKLEGLMDLHMSVWFHYAILFNRFLLFLYLQGMRLSILLFAGLVFFGLSVLVVDLFGLEI